MADEDKVIDEDAIKAEAHTEAKEKLAEDVKNKKTAVESSIKDVLTGAGLDAEFTQKEDKLVVEIPLSNKEEHDALVAKMVAEKMKQAEEEAARKAEEEVARRQAEIEAAAREKAEQEAKEKAEREAREAAEKAELERKEAEEKARKEEEAARLAAEEKAKAEEQKKAVLEAEKKAKEEEKKRKAEEKARLDAEIAAKKESEASQKAKSDADKEAKKKAQEETKKRNAELAAAAKAEKKPQAKKQETSDKFIPNFKRLYLEKVRSELQKEFNYSSPMQIPRLTKITVSVGCGEAVANKKYLDAAVKELEQITGQHVLRTKARKAIANFKIRQGMEIGAMVTLRGDNMWYFLERLISIALPRVRDFRGVKKTSFDGRGNYSLGITEQIIFPEIDFDKIERVSGLNVAIVTTAESDKEGFALLKALGMPFVR